MAIRNLTETELLGQSHQKTTDIFQQSLDLKTAPGGVYFVEIRMGDAVFRKQVVKQ